MPARCSARAAPPRSQCEHRPNSQSLSAARTAMQGGGAIARLWARRVTRSRVVCTVDVVCGVEEATELGSAVVHRQEREAVALDGPDNAQAQATQHGHAKPIHLCRVPEAGPPCQLGVDEEGVNAVRHLLSAHRASHLPDVQRTLS